MSKDKSRSLFAMAVLNSKAYAECSKMCERGLPIIGKYQDSKIDNDNVARIIVYDFELHKTVGCIVWELCDKALKIPSGILRFAAIERNLPTPIEQQLGPFLLHSAGCQLANETNGYGYLSHVLKPKEEPQTAKLLETTGWLGITLPKEYVKYVFFVNDTDFAMRIRREHKGESEEE